MPCDMSDFLPLTREVREPIAAWRDYSGEAAAILNVSDALRAGVRPDPAFLERLVTTTRAHTANHDQRREQRRRWQVVARRVDAWLALGGVRPTLSVRGEPRLTLGSGSGLFGGLAAILALAVARGDGLVACSYPGCMDVAEPARSDALRHYCSEHRGERHAANMRAWRERRRAQA
jgi:hypothetical protein